MELDRRAFAYFNTELDDWHAASGNYQILVGASSQDIRLQAEVQVESGQTDVTIPERDKLQAYVEFPADAKVSQVDFEMLLGRPVPSNQVTAGEKYTINTPLGDMRGTFIGRQLGRVMSKRIESIVSDDPDSPTSMMMRHMLQGMPLRTLLMMGGDALNRDMLEALLLILNGKLFKGLGALVKARK